MARSILMALVLLASSLAAIGAGPRPAGAELASVATTAWGVSGLRTGTQTESIAAPIFTMERIGNVMYVGGRFLNVTNGSVTLPQASLAAFDAITGEWLPTFTPQLNGAVYALESSPDGSRLFVGGDFTTVNGTTTGALIALDPATGAIDPSWTGRVGGYQVVRDFDIDGGSLYAGGGFTTVTSAAGSNAAGRVARFDLANGAHDSAWLPLIDGGTVWGLDVSPDAGRVYLAGTFTTSNGVAAPGGFVSLETATPTNTAGVAPLQVNAVLATNQYSYDVVATNGNVFVAGSQYFVQVLNEADLALETFHLSKYAGDYQHLEVIGNRVYAGCHCRQDTTLASANGVLWSGTPPDGQVNAPTFAQAPNSWAAAFDATTGLHLPDFRPNVGSTGAGVWAIEEGLNGCIWFGGALTSTGGTTQRAMTRLCDGDTADFTRPSTPGRPIAGSVGVDSIAFSWNPSTDDVGVMAYRLYDAVTHLPIVDSTTTSTTVTGLAPGAYSFYTKAYDAAGNLSTRSGITSVTVTGVVPDTVRPSTPGRPIAGAILLDGVSFTWNPSTDNVGVAGYRLYNSVTNAVVVDVPGTATTLTGLVPGTYSYYTRSYDAAGNVSSRSAITSVTIVGVPPDTVRPSTPGKPIVGAIGPDSVFLTWNPSTDNVGVVDYQVFDLATNTVVATSPTNAITLTGLVPGSYTFYVKTRDAAGNVSWKSGNTTVTITG